MATEHYQYGGEIVSYDIEPLNEEDEDNNNNGE